MIIILKTLDGDSFELDVGVKDKLRVVKEKIFEQEGLFVEFLRLIFAGKELEDEREVYEYGIQRESTIYIVFRHFSG